MIPVRLASDGYTVIERGDECLGVRFDWLEILNEAKTSEKGIPVYDQVEMIEVTIPGDKTTVLHRKVSDEDKRRFADKYKSFIQANSNKDKSDGTPLNQFPFISVAERKELEYFNVYTAEQLVNMPDGNIDKLAVNGRDLIKKVEAFMQMAKDTSVVSRMTQENESLKREMDLMKEQMQQILRMKEEDEVNKPETKIEKGKKNGKHAG